MIGEICDCLAGCLIQYGNFLKIRKKAVGWLCSMIAIVYWVFRAHTTGFVMQQFWHITSFMVASYGFFNWLNQSKRQEI